MRDLVEGGSTENSDHEPVSIFIKIPSFLSILRMVVRLGTLLLARINMHTIVVNLLPTHRPVDHDLLPLDIYFQWLNVER